MPTTEHEAVVDLFRDNPPLAPHLLELVFGMDVPAYKEVDVGDPTANQTMSVEFRADLVLELKDEAQNPVLSIIVEVQREDDRRKELSWPVYVAVQRSRKPCPTILLVVATNAEVAEWASKPIDLGFGLTTMRPLVLGPSVIPVMTDPAAITRDLELALLSVLSHDEGDHGLEVVQTFVDTVGRIENENSALYLAVVYNHVREHLKRAIEVMFMEQRAEGKTIPLPPFMQVVFDRGELKGERSMLLRLLQRAGIDLTSEQRARIETCTDLATLDRWADNVIGAKSASDVFG